VDVQENNIMEHNLHSGCYPGKRQSLKDYCTLKKSTKQYK